MANHEPPTAPRPRHALGLMSGTSQDGVDAVVMTFDAATGRPLGVRGAATRHYPDALRARLLALAADPDAPLSLREAALADQGIAEVFAEAGRAALRAAGLDAAGVEAAGMHGQTVFHDPARGQSWQWGNPSWVAARLGVPVVADFRRADVALGGQGAPLVPAFHAAAFGGAAEARAVLNLGGIANVTVLPPAGAADPVRGWDTGPANALLDDGAQAHRGTAFDEDGRFAAEGREHAGLLEHLLGEPWFALPPPKSTGRDVFGRAWLARHAAAFPDLSPADVQATLVALTADSVAASLRAHGAASKRLLVCGGGAHNPVLVARLARALPGVTVETTAAHGLDPQHVEAAAFAWLALRRLDGLPGALPAVTGAARAAVLGGVFRP